MTTVFKTKTTLINNIKHHVSRNTNICTKITIQIKRIIFIAILRISRVHHFAYHFGILLFSLVAIPSVLNQTVWRHRTLHLVNKLWDTSKTALVDSSIHELVAQYNFWCQEKSWCHQQNHMNRWNEGNFKRFTCSDKKYEIWTRLI